MSDAMMGAHQSGGGAQGPSKTLLPMYGRLAVIPVTSKNDKVEDLTTETPPMLSRAPAAVASSQSLLLGPWPQPRSLERLQKATE